MLKIAIKFKPDFVCLVPEKRKEVTTEGGLNLRKNLNYLKKAIKQLKKNKIRVSLFIEPNSKDVLLAKKYGANCVELHTGTYCNLVNKNKYEKFAYNNLKKSALLASMSGLDVHAGHGISYKSVKKIAKIKNISELNIGHFIVSEAVFFGLKNPIKKFKKIINK